MITRDKRDACGNEPAVCDDDVISMMSSTTISLGAHLDLLDREKHPGVTGVCWVSSIDPVEFE